MTLKLSTSFVASFMLLMVSSQTQAQEIAKMHHDYHSGSVTYSPDDPWTRSKLFNAHTGHSGNFYNCDGEECKRYSSYIYWQTNCQSLTPPRRGLLNQLRRDQGRIQQRIADGSCSCSACQTANGSLANVVKAEPQIDDAMIVDRLPPPPKSSLSEAAPLPSTKNRSVRELASDIKFGLVNHPELKSSTEAELTRPNQMAAKETDRFRRPIANKAVAAASTQPQTVAPRMGLLSQHPHQKKSGGVVQVDVAPAVPSNQSSARTSSTELATQDRTADQKIINDQHAFNSVYGRRMIQFDRHVQSESPIQPKQESNLANPNLSEAVAQSTIAPAAVQRHPQKIPARTAAATPLNYFAPK